MTVASSEGAAGANKRSRGRERSVNEQTWRSSGSLCILAALAFAGGCVTNKNEAQVHAAEPTRRASAEIHNRERAELRAIASGDTVHVFAWKRTECIRTSTDVEWHECGSSLLNDATVTLIAGGVEVTGRTDRGQAFLNFSGIASAPNDPQNADVELRDGEKRVWAHVSLVDSPSYAMWKQHADAKVKESQASAHEAPPRTAAQAGQASNDAWAEAAGTGSIVGRAPEPQSPRPAGAGNATDAAWAQAQQDQRQNVESLLRQVEKDIASLRRTNTWGTSEITKWEHALATVLEAGKQIPKGDPLAPRLLADAQNVQGLQGTHDRAVANRERRESDARARATQGSATDCVNYCKRLYDGFQYDDFQEQAACVQSCATAMDNCTQCCHISRASATPEHCQAVCSRNMRNFVCQ